MDDDIEGLVASLVVALVDSRIAFRIAKDDYQAALQRGVSPDLARGIARENFRIAREEFSKVSEHVNACADWMMREYAPQADAAGPSSSQQAPMQQDVADASEKPVEHNAAREESVEKNTAAPEETVENTATSEETLRRKRNKAATEETVEHDTGSQEEAAENNTIAPEETVEHSRPKKAARISDP